MSVVRLTDPRRISANSVSAAAGSYGVAVRNVSGLAAWYDATVSSSLFDAVSGGAAVANNGSVMRWEDLSGNGIHLTQPANTTNNAPIRKVADSNTANKDSVLFDGSNDVLQLNATLFPGNGATMFIVHKFQSNQDRGLHTFTGVSAANHHPFGGAFYDGFFNGTRRSWTQAYSSSLRLYSVISGTSWIAHINGTAVNTVTGTAPAAQFNSRIECFGCGDNTTGSPSGFVNAYFCEIVLYWRALSTSEHTSVCDYLKAKWSL